MQLQCGHSRHTTLSARKRALPLSKRTSVPVLASTGGPGDGPTGLNVGQFRPTSKKGWEQMRNALLEANVKVISPQEVVFALERGNVKVLDVRPKDLFAKGHLPGAFNVPFYQPIEGWTPWQVARRVGYALFGVLNGTEPNPKFMEEVEAQVDKEEQLLVYCTLGGNLEQTNNSRHGAQTRSMIAAYNLVSSGYASVGVLKGGFSGWVSAGREVVGVPGGEEAATEAQSSSDEQAASSS